MKKKLKVEKKKIGIKDIENVVKKDKDIYKIINVLITIFIKIPLAIFGISFVILGIYCINLTNDFSKDFLKTTAYLSDFSECENDIRSVVCAGVYEFNVTNETYLAVSNMKASKDKVKEIQTVKYDKDDPNKNVVDDNAYYMFIIEGAIFFISAILMFKFLIIKPKKK